MTDPDNPFDDKPIEEIITIIEEYKRKLGTGQQLTTWIKFTCLHCGARQTSNDEDTFHTGGYTCEECGALSHPTRYGLRILISNDPDDPVLRAFKNKKPS